MINPFFSSNSTTDFMELHKDHSLNLSHITLSYYFGEKYVATTPNNIARIVRLVVEEMQERYQYMRDNFQYGTNFADHGFKPVWLIFDEMGAFKASGTDKKSKEVIAEVMDGIKQIILMGELLEFSS